MKWNVKYENLRVKTGKMFFLGILLLASSVILSCSQPVLESSECIKARDPLKRFYSFHIGNEMTPSIENLDERKKFLSTRLIENLKQLTPTKMDYFTQTEDYPKAFRAGKCETIDTKRASFKVLLFWRTNDENIQREITVESVNEGDEWLIDTVKPNN